MFLFSCCTEATNNESYEIRTKKHHQTTFEVMKAQDRLNKKQVESETQVLKVKKSQFKELLKLHNNSKQLWEDPEFPPLPKSLG